MGEEYSEVRKTLQELWLIAELLTPCLKDSMYGLRLRIRTFNHIISIWILCANLWQLETTLNPTVGGQLELQALHILPESKDDKQ